MEKVSSPDEEQGADMQASYDSRSYTRYAEYAEPFCRLHLAEHISWDQDDV